ncbi:hypothetical protein pdam_00025440, partial [Pocillopora damicornis]
NKREKEFNLLMYNKAPRLKFVIQATDSSKSKGRDPTMAWQSIVRIYLPLVILKRITFMELK